MSPSAPSTPGQLTRRQIISAMVGLIVAMLLAQLDNMIVAPALPTIVGDLGGASHLSWVVTGYILASTVSTPLWGKMGDLLGHKAVFLASIVTFLIGSALCGMSQNMTELVGFRALQGLGGGGLTVGIISVIGMIASPRDRGKYQGVMMAVMPAAMIGGPLIGGAITDHASWRWVFYVNLPLGLISLAVIWFTLRLPSTARAAGRVVIDWWGAAVLSLWISALVLLVTWGGIQYAWNSWQILGLGLVSLVGFVVFIAIEQRVAEPVMPLRLFSNLNFSLASALGFVSGFAMFGAITFLPQFQQFVQHQSATNSGLLLLPMLLGAMVMSLVGGMVISKTGHYRSFPIAGTALLALGLALLSTMDLRTSTGTTSLYMVVLGAGMGCLMQTTNVIAQNSVTPSDIGVASGTSTFTRNMGGSLGLAVLGAFYTHHLTSTLGSAATGGVDHASGLTPGKLASLPVQFQELFKTAVSNGTHWVFLSAAIIAAVGVVLALMIKHVPLRQTVGTPTHAVEETVESLAI